MGGVVIAESVTRSDDQKELDGQQLGTLGKAGTNKHSPACGGTVACGSYYLR